MYALVLMTFAVYDGDYDNRVVVLKVTDQEEEMRFCLREARERLRVRGFEPDDDDLMSFSHPRHQHVNACMVVTQLTDPGFAGDFALHSASGTVAMEA